MSDQMSLGLAVPETYRDTLGRIAYEGGGNRNINGGFVSSYDGLDEAVKVICRQRGTAVAAQVLRDVIETTKRHGPNFDLCPCQTCRDLRERVRRFASENGIDLGEVTS